ncbi:MAG: SRPBCC family protein [Phenylobacterium sp.]|uniref:SRPBCC family protein n=1 Tax=Phenylobacterium sp. TaxID=1871053 RepID=UPI0039191D48
MHLIRTESFIDAPPDRVWEVLADFSRYHEWNPLNVKAKGEARPGARLDLTFLNLAGKPGATIRQPARLVACEPGREIAWQGVVPLIFHGRHGFHLTPEGQGTRVIQTESLRGLLPAVWSAERIARDFTPHYEAVDRALAARVAALG